MSPAFAAHLRLLEALADRVTTHLMEMRLAQTVGHNYGREVPDYLVEEVDRLRKQNMTQREVISRLHIGTKTYTRILAVLKQKK